MSNQFVNFMGANFHFLIDHKKKCYLHEILSLKRKPVFVMDLGDLFPEKKKNHELLWTF
jgi:hypothetical protein